MTDPFLDRLRSALTLPDFDVAAAYQHMAPDDRPFRPSAQPVAPRPAAVLILMYRLPDAGWAFPLIRRASYPGVHSDQIGLPGGQLEPDETADGAALRETCEEIGVCDSITLIGALSPLYVPPSNFTIQPFVGISEGLPIFQPDPREVADVFLVALADLFNPALKRSDEREFVPGRTFQRPYYWLGEQIVWGATAIMLSEFEHRLRAVGLDQMAAS